ncbi:hypothetical protein CR513_49832, partial [Mucuna pruriens]
MTLRLSDEKIMFRVFDSLKSPSSLASYGFIQGMYLIEALVISMLSREGRKDSLKKVPSTLSRTKALEKLEVRGFNARLEARAKNLFGGSTSVRVEVLYF